MKLKACSSSIFVVLLLLLFAVPSLASPPIDLTGSSVLKETPAQLKIAQADASLESVTVTSGAAVKEASPAVKARASEAYGKLPLYFIKNDGQLDGQVKYYVKGAGYTIYFTQKSVKFSLYKTEKVSAKAGKVDAPANRKTVITGSEFFSLSLVDSNKKAKVIGSDEQAGKVNYFIGNDKSKWRSNVPTFASVLYKDVYKGIDLKFYGKGQTLEYDVIVKAGADPRKVKFVYEGIKGLRVTDSGDMQIGLEDALVVQHKPFTYQDIEGKRVEIESSFSLLKGKKNEHAYSFEVASYDKKYPLIIDPALTYSTYLGGSSADFGRGIDVDSSGNAYVTGLTDSSTDFPLSSAYQGTYGGGTYDVFITKINAAGSALVYSTFLGGAGDDTAEGIAVDSSGNAYVTGYTLSTDFPLSSAYDSTLNDGVITGVSDVFVTKLNAAGSALTYSTYFGGDSDDYGMAIDVITSNKAHITGYTGSSNFPTDFFALDTTLGGTYDAFITKFNVAGSGFDHSTYMGGSGDDIGYGIALDSIGDIYITGQTTSSDYPTLIAFQGSYGGGTSDAFVSKISNLGGWRFSTYLGGSASDIGMGVAVDSFNNAYVTGQTDSTDFPTNSPVYASNSGGVDGFVTKFSTSGGTTVYSTYLGGSSTDTPRAIAVDSSWNAIVMGETYSSNFPMVSALDSSLGGTIDVFVSKINNAGSALDFSTYHGGTADDKGYGIAVDSSGDVYLVGETLSTDFPTSSPYQGSNAGTTDAFITKIGMNTPELAYSAEAGYGGADGVDPEIGTTSTTFTYKVVYTSPSDTAPSYIRTITDAGSNAMSLDTGAAASLQDGDYTNGEQYIFSTSGLAIGTRTYYFYASDGTNFVSLPSSGSITNPFIATLAISTSSFTDGTISTAFSQSLAATGGTSPYTWAIASGTLPAGLSLNTSSGEVSGTPSAVVSSAFTAQVTDNSSYVVTKALSITINYPTLIITTSSLVGGQVTIAYSQSAAATGGDTSYTWSLASGTLPAGLSLNSSSGVVSGTPTTSGTSNFTLQVDDGSSNIDTQALSITVAPAPSLVILTSSLSGGATGVAYSRTLSATGGVSPYTWSLASGTLPAGLSLDPSTGVIDGTPSATGDTAFTIRVTDNDSTVTDKALSISIFTSDVDLYVSALSAPGSVTAGTNISVSSTVDNLGTDGAGTFFIYYYVSTNTSITTSDRLVGYRVFWSGLAGGDSQSTTSNIYWPLDLSSGTYYIGAIVDTSNLIAESDEANNTRVSSAISVSPGVDLVVTSVSIPSSVSAGGSIVIDSTLANTGSANATAFLAKYYLSTDTALDGGDASIYTRNLSSGIISGGTDVSQVTAAIPVGTAAGTYYVIVDADTGDTNPESDEANNTGVSAGTVTVTAGVDLVVSALSIPSTATAGGSLAINSTVGNTGDVNSTSFIVKYYLSTDTALSAGDIIIYTRNISSGIISGGSNVSTISAAIPVGTAAGTYYVIADADTANTNPESNEANNTGLSGTVSVTAGVDLVVSAVSIPSTATAGGSIAIDSTIGNTGTTNSSTFLVKYYLSTDTALDGGDASIYTRIISNGIISGGTDVSTISAAIPVGTAAGTYYVIADADTGETNPESSEANNTGVSSGTVTISAGVDLVVSAVSAPSSATVGGLIAIDSTIGNPGTVNSLSFTVRYHLSTDTTLSADDIIIYTRSIWSGIISGGTDVSTMNAAIPADTATGTYYVIIDADTANTNPESSEVNNTGVSGSFTVSP